MKYGYLLSALALLAGCQNLPSVGPNYEQPEVDLPEFALPDAGAPTTNKTEFGEYKPASSEEDARQVLTPTEVAVLWEKFDDPVLTSLLDEAVSNNVSFLMAQERLIAARWALLGTYAAYLPQVRGEASAIRSEYGANTASGRGAHGHRNVFAGGFDATWEIDIFGGSRRATQAAGAQVAAAEWSVADAQVSLLAEVANQYIALRTTQQRLQVERTNLKLQTETYEILKSRLDSGIGDELAVNQSKYIVDQTRAQIPPLLAQEEVLKNALAILVGAMPGALHERLATCPTRDWLLAPTRFDLAPLNLIRLRPDVRRVEAELEAEVARVGVAKAQWFPKLYINGSLGLESLHATDFFKKESIVGAIGPSVSWPIFQGGNIYANIKAQEARMNEKLLAYELALQTAYGEVREAYSAYTQEYHRYQSLQGAVQAAKDAVQISNDLYTNGLRDFTAVIDAQRSLLSLESALVVSRGQITQNLIALYKSLGGGLSAGEE